MFSSIVYRPGRNPLTFFSGLVREYGDIVHLKAGGEHMFLVTNPRHVRDILVTNQRNFRKGRGLERSKALLGEGLLTSEGETHLRQRRLMQPTFHKDRIAGYASVMTDYADRAIGRWIDGATIDAADDMMRLTLNVVGKTLFDADVESQAKDVGVALAAVMGSFWIRMLPFADTIERLPLPALRRAREARVTLDRIIYRIIAERRQSPGDRGDLLSMLLMARDEDDGRGMSDEQVRDEVMTIFLAGHETTANALSWTWYLLSQTPEVEARLHEEVDRVLAGRLPRLEDIAVARVRRAGRDRGDAVISAGVDDRPARHRCVCHRRLLDSGAVARPGEPVSDATRCPLFSRAGALQSRSLDAGAQGRAAAVCVFSLRRRHSPLHRRVVRVDGAGAGAEHDRPEMAAPPGAWSPRRHPTGRHLTDETRAQDGDVAGGGERLSFCVLVLRSTFTFSFGVHVRRSRFGAAFTSVTFVAFAFVARRTRTSNETQNGDVNVTRSDENVERPCVRVVRRVAPIA